MAGSNCACQKIYPAVSNMFSIKIPYLNAGLFIKTSVTAPRSFRPAPPATRARVIVISGNKFRLNYLSLQNELTCYNRHIEL